MYIIHLQFPFLKFSIFFQFTKLLRFYDCKHDKQDVANKHATNKFAYKPWWSFNPGAHWSTIFYGFNGMYWRGLSSFIHSFITTYKLTNQNGHSLATKFISFGLAFNNRCAMFNNKLWCYSTSNVLSLNYWMIVEKYPKRTEWLVVQFPVVKSPLYLTETSQVVNHLLYSKKKKWK